MRGHRNQPPAPCDAGRAPRGNGCTSVPPLAGLGVKPGAVAAILACTPDPLWARCAGVVEMATYLVLSSFTGQPIKRFAAKPPDQAAVVRSSASAFALWFSAELASGISLSVGPGDPPTHWGMTTAPLRCPVQLAPGIIIRAKVRTAPARPVGTWTSSANSRCRARAGRSTTSRPSGRRSTTEQCQEP